jgi:hypothetical protein
MEIPYQHGQIHYIFSSNHDNTTFSTDNSNGNGNQDVLPALLHIVCRPLRPVAVRLLNPEERSGLASLVATMADYAIAFDSSPSFTPGADVGALALTPPVHTVCCFPVSCTLLSSSPRLLSLLSLADMHLC